MSERYSGASWIGLGQASERPLPSWLAPPPDPTPLALRWTNRPGGESEPPPPSTSTLAALSYAPAPRIDFGDGDEMDLPPPSVRLVVPTGPSEADLAKLAIVAELEKAVFAARSVVEEARREALATTEKDIVKLAIAIAERVLIREVQIDPRLVVAWAREGVETLGATDEVTIILAPEVVEALAAGEDGAAASLGHVIADARLTRSECRVKTKFGSVDEGLRSRLDSVVAALELEDES